MNERISSPEKGFQYLQNVTQCKGNSPVFVSRPHFYLADPFYRNQFQQGIEPIQGFHDSFFRIEPSSSIPVEVKMKLQLNVFLRNVKGIEYLFKEVPNLMFPVFWFETEITMQEQMLRSLRMLLITPKIIQVVCIHRWKKWCNTATMLPDIF